MDNSDKILRITLDTSLLCKELRSKLVKALEKAPGDTPVQLLLCDKRTGTEIPFTSNKYQIEATLGLMRDLRAIGVTAEMETIEELEDPCEDDQKKPVYLRNDDQIDPTSIWDFSNMPF